MVEPAFHFAGEGLVVILFGFGVPGFGVFFEPDLAVGFPLDDEFLRDGVGESPGDEDVGSFLMPVGEVVVVDVDLFIGVEEHGVVTPSPLGLVGCGGLVEKWRGSHDSYVGLMRTGQTLSSAVWVMGS